MGPAASRALARACVQRAGYSSSRQHACAHLNKKLKKKEKNYFNFTQLLNNLNKQRYEI
jgi:hypothetical protein